MSIQINREIDYASLFGLLSQKLVPILGVFKAPNIIWNIINYLSLVLEKNAES